MSNFITEIKIGKVRHLENINIILGEEKKHLILTGKNGSGKTSVLENLHRYFIRLSFSTTRSLADIKKENKIFNLRLSNELFSSEICDESFEFIYAYFSAKRGITIEKPKGIKKIDLIDNLHSQKKGFSSKKLNQNFLQYIVNLKAERSFARDDNDIKSIEAIDTWFKKFENMLRQIFNDDSLSLTFDRKQYNFIIHRKNREPFDFDGLSDGYSAIIDIITEIILKVEATESYSFNCEGVVLIDEIETHLHVELQKNILPLLTSFFPNIQFIVTTHSPFVLSSLENTVIYDLEKQIQVEDLSGYSYESLVDTYFDTDKYSDEVKEKLKKYKELTLRDIDNNLEKEELREYLKIEMFFENLPKYKNEEIGFQFNRIQQLKLGA